VAAAHAATRHHGYDLAHDGTIYATTIYSFTLLKIDAFKRIE
jgi:hypothetical protein